MPLSDLISRQKNMEAYIREDSELARKLVLAGDNIDLRRKALKENILDDFLEPIIDDDKYMDFVDEVVKSVKSKFPEEEQKILTSQLGIRQERTAKVKTVEKIIVPKNIKQKTSKGKSYNRSYKKWSSSETQFLKARIRKGYSLSKTKEEFYKFYGNDSKTKSSLKTKFYRLKGGN